MRPPPLRTAGLLAAGLLVLTGCGSSAVEPASVPRADRSASSAPDTAVATPSPVADECPVTAEPFEPARARIPGVGRDLVVVTPPRASPEVPGTPPVDDTGKGQLAFDRVQGVEPGDRRGNVLLNAHTWPDGSGSPALGNRLLDELRTGDRLVLAGEGRSLCYRVTERVEVPADQPFPRYYRDDGPPQVALVVCSGERLGPGVWTERTVWFASPAA